MVERDKALAIVRSNEGVESAVATARQYVDAAEAVCDRFPAGTATDALRAAPAALLATVYTRSAGLSQAHHIRRTRSGAGRDAD